MEIREQFPRSGKSYPFFIQAFPPPPYPARAIAAKSSPFRLAHPDNGSTRVYMLQ